MSSNHEASGGETDGGQRLDAAERQYYSNMCDQLFQKYTNIKARNVEGKKSRVWKCFVPGRNMAAMCRLCRALVKQGTKGDTTDLTAHLQRYHVKEWDEMVEAEAIKQVTYVYISPSVNTFKICLTLKTFLFDSA